MERFKHCSLCDNHIMEMMKGIKCGLTGAKSDFKFRCAEALFKTKAFQKIEDLNLQYEFMKRKKAALYISFVVKLSLALFVLLTGIFAVILFLTYGIIFSWRMAGAIGFTGIGLIIFSSVMKPWINYKNEMNILKKKLNDIKKVLNIYNLEYTIETAITGGTHDIFDVTTNITFSKKGVEIEKYQNRLEYTPKYIET